MSEIHSTKTCTKCSEEKPIDDFYVYGKNRHLHTGKCKECTKSDVRCRYEKERPKIAAYERNRFKTPHRKALVIEYQKTSRRRHRQKYLARKSVGRAIRDGKLVRKPCEFCGSLFSEAHHEDYSKPFQIVWACFQCHREKCHGQKCNA